MATVAVVADEPPTDLPTIINPTVILDNVAKCLQSGNPDSFACKKAIANLEDLTQLKKECKKKKNKNKDVCKELNQLPDFPGVSLGGLVLGNGGLGLPLPRAGFGPTEKWSASGPTMGQLMKIYDPALVSLLVPGMVVR